MTNHTNECDPEMHAGFTGTRRGMTLGQKAAFREHLDINDHIAYLHHGDCIGADADAHQLALYFGIRIWTHPPNSGKYRAYVGQVHHQELPKPYIPRNHDIVNASKYLIATPATDTEVLRSGTWTTIRYARKQGKEIVIFWPNGSETREEP